MEEIFISIMEKAAQFIPELAVVDEDYGQLEMLRDESDIYPLTFPALLIGDTESDWSNVGTSFQKSVTSVTVKLAVDCYDDTHFSSGTYDKIRERCGLAHKVYKAVQGLCPSSNSTPLCRVKSGSYTASGGIKVIGSHSGHVCLKIVRIPGKATAGHS